MNGEKLIIHFLKKKQVLGGRWIDITRYQIQHTRKKSSNCPKLIVNYDSIILHNLILDDW